METNTMIFNFVNFLTKPLSILTIILAFGLSGCGGGGDSSPAPAPTITPPLDEPVETQSITGGGVKGPLANAVVTVYAFDASKAGFKGAAVGTGNTDASAAITGLALPFPLNPPYIMEFTSTAGTTSDITTGQFPVITTMRTVITQASIDAGEQIYATPLTTMAVDIAVANANAGAGTGTSSAQFETAITAAAAQVVSTLGFGMDSSVNIFDTPPLINSTTAGAAEQTAVAAYRTAVEAVTAIAYQINQQSSGASTDTVLADLAADLADGDIDGSAGTTLDVNTLQVLQQDPATLPIPNSPTNQTVADVQTILATETATTGSTTTTTDLTDGTITTVSAPAETDPDIDNDGVLNVDDAYPNDATADTDTDGDGAPDTAWTDASRATIDAARSDADDDNDGWLDIEDDYTTDATRFLDPALDRDVDTIANGTDNCPLTSNTDQLDTDANGQGDACSNDSDGDGVDDGVDNCPLVANPSQTDTGGSADGDACDINIDGDAADNDVDAFPYDSNETVDTDGDGIGNTADTDDDNDGVADGSDTGTSPLDGTTACSLLRDCDGDGVLDAADFNPVNPAIKFNFAPVTAGANITTDEDVAVAVTLSVTDDGVAPGPLVYNISGPAHGVLSGTEPDLTYTPNAQFSGSDSFIFTAVDSAGKISNISNVTLTVVAINDAPVAADDAASTNEDTAVTTADVRANDSDVEGDTLTVSLLANASNGNVVDNTDGTFTYTPDSNFNGSDSFTYTLSDGNGGSATATVNITVNAVNDNPVANADSLTTAEDTAGTTVDVTVNDTDVDVGAVLSVVAGNPTAVNGTVVNNNDGTFTYTPNADFNGSDSFTYDLSDGTTGTASGTVNVTVNAVNDDPVASDDTATTDEDTAVTTSDVTANDTDVDAGTTLSVVAGDPTAANGTVVNNNDGTFTYTPDADFNGADNFTYTVSDGNGGTATGTVNITVNVVNDNPVANADSLTTPEDTAGTTVDVTVNDTDVDAGTTFTVAAGNPTATNGSVVNNDDGTFTYTPDANYNGADSFSYTLEDGNGGSATGTVNVTVTPVNDNPVGSSDVMNAGVATLVSLNVLANDSDVDGDSLTITGVSAGSRGSTLTHNGSTVSFTDTVGAGTETFTYDISDGNGGTATGISVTVTVTANISPVANADSATTDEDNAVTTVNVLTNDTDGGDGPGVLSINGADAISAQGGSVTNHGDGTFTYTPLANFNGSDSFTYTVSDTAGTSVGTVNITVNAVNDVPVATQDDETTAEDTAFTTGNVLTNDNDGGDGPSALSITFYDLVSVEGGVVGYNDNGTFDYSPPGNFNGPDSFTYTVSDGGDAVVGQVVIDVTAVNDAPNAVDDSESTTVNTAFKTANVLTNDSDIEGDALSIVAGNPTAAHGTVENHGDGTFTYTPANDYIGSDSFSYSVTDTTDTSVGTVNITVNPAGTPISTVTLLDSTGVDGGLGGLEPTYAEADGSIAFEYWTDAYNASAGQFVFEDFEYNYDTSAYQLLTGINEDLVLTAGGWVRFETIDAANDGSGNLDITLRDATTAAIATFNVTARESALSGNVQAYLQSDGSLDGWANGMDPAATFSANAKTITDYRFTVTGATQYWLGEHFDCDEWNPGSLATLNGNCNAVELGIGTNTYATTLSQVVAVSAWTYVDDGTSTAPTGIFVAHNGANNSALYAELVSDNTTNFYIVNHDGYGIPGYVSDYVSGTAWSSATVQGKTLYEFVIPSQFANQFPGDVSTEAGLSEFVTVQNGFVRRGWKQEVGSYEPQGETLLNVAAINDVINNHDPVKALGYNYVNLIGNTAYDLYYDSSLTSWCLDFITVSDGTNMTLGDYGVMACDGINPASSDPGTYSVDSVTGVMTLSVGLETWYSKVVGFNTTYSAKETCASLSDTGPWTCTEGDDFFGYQFFDATAAENAMTALNTPAPALPFPDAATLAGTTQYNVFYCDDCSPEGYIMEALEFVDASNYTLTTIPGGTPEVGTYSIVNGILAIDDGTGPNYIQIISVDGATGANRICWESSLANLSNCDSLGYDFFFDNQTDAQNFLDTLTFSGAPVDASTVLAGNGVYEFWDEWNGEVGYWNLAYDGVSTIVDEEGYWNSSMSAFGILPAETDIMLTASGWQQHDIVVDAISVTSNTATLDVYDPGLATVDSWDMAFEAMDISTREIGLYAPTAMLDNKSATFSAGAQWIQATFTHNMDYTQLYYWDETSCGTTDYTNWGSNCNIVWQRTMTGLDVDTSLVASDGTNFVDVAGETIELGSHNNSGSFGTSLLGVFSGGTITYYTVNWDAGTTAVNTGVTGSYTLLTDVSGVTGLDVIEYEVPTSIPDYASFNLRYDVEDNVIGVLSIHNNFLRYGEREPISITGSLPMLNSVAAADIFSNLAPVSYTCNYSSGWDDFNNEPVTFNSYTDFQAVVTACGGVLITTTLDMVGTWSESWTDVDGDWVATWVFEDTTMTATFTETLNGSVTDSGTVGWSITNDLVTLTDNANFIDVWARTSSGIKVYTEESGWSVSPDVTTLDATAEGEIWDHYMVKQ